MKLKYPTELENLHEILGKIEQFATDSRCSTGRLMQFTIIAEELIVNIMSYAYAEGKGPLHIELLESDDSITLILSDDGIEFNPLNADAPDRSSSIDKREVGGLGIYMVQKFAERVTYTRLDGKNIFTVVYLK